MPPPDNWRWREPQETNIPTTSGVGPLTTSVLLIDGDSTHRIGFANHLKNFSPDYQILEAKDGEEGLAIFRSRKIDCVVLEIDLPDRSGCEVLMTLVPRPSKPDIAVIVLTKRMHRGLSELATKNGAYACFVKEHTTGEDLDRAIQRAVALVGQMPTEERYRVPIMNYGTSRTAE